MATLYGARNNTDGLVLYLDVGNYKSYISGSTTLTDLSGNNNSGSIFNNPVFDSGSGGNIRFFSGSTQYVETPSIAGLGTSNRTFMCWFNVPTTPVGVAPRILTFPADNTSTDRPAIAVTCYGNLTMEIGFGGTPYDGYITRTFALNTWYHLAAIISGSTVTVYRNMSLLGSASNTGLVGANPIGQIARYNANYGQYSDAKVSMLAVYNRALSAEEILQNFNAQRSRFGV